MPYDQSKYILDPTDQLPCEIVGEWSRDKHQRLTKYIDISRAVRSKWLSGQSGEATFIDLYSGPGRCQIKGQTAFSDGGCVAGWRKSLEGGQPFTKVFISDFESELADAAEARLRSLNAPVYRITGTTNRAEDIVKNVVAQLSPYGLHFAYLDPFSLSSLPFSVITDLATLNRMDILIHISLMDFQRNAREYSNAERTELDRFAPGWRDHVAVTPNQSTFRANLLAYWKSLIKKLGMQTAEGIELVQSPNGQRLYWLAFVARNATAIDFWDKIRVLDGQQSLL